MKRFIIAAVLVVTIIGVGFVSIFQLARMTDLMSAELDSLLVSVYAKEQAQVLEKADKFQKLWEEEERSMMRYIHHDELDAITGTVARLEALAQYEEYPELAAEIDRLRHLVRHIYESEMPSFSSIF